jgi:hypothetical protein
MDVTAELHTIAEVSITLAGFCGLVTILRGGRLDTWRPREQFTFWLLLAFTLGALIFGLLPSAVAMSGSENSTLWRISNGIFGGTLVAGLLTSSLLGRWLRQQGFPAMRPAAWFLFPPVLLLESMMLLWGASGGWPGEGPFIYYCGLLLLLLGGIVQFVFLLLQVAPREQRSVVASDSQSGSGISACLSTERRASERHSG